MTTCPRQERRPALPLLLAGQPVSWFRLTPSPRGTRLARRPASCRMDAWGRHHGTPVHDSVELIAAEPAADAVTRDRVPGREDDGRVRVEVSDARGGTAARGAGRRKR